MIVLTVDSITKHFGPEPVLAGVTFDVHRGQRVGLVGPNGAGKSTLLNILCGKLEPDAGTAQWNPGVDVGFVEQHSEFDGSRTVWEEAEDALADQKQLSTDAEHLARMMAQTTDATELRELEARFDAVQEELERRDAYHLDHKVERILQGMGFAADSFPQPANQLSGGQQNRLLLAKLLLRGPDVLLLDEPSNHLDIEGTTWLEDYLANSRQTVIVVSHDRYFLDKVTDVTLELFRGTVDSYKGNFSAYRTQKAERVELQRRTYENQQTEIAKLEDFIRRHHHGQKHAQAEDRRKKLERIARVEPPREIGVPPMRFPEASRSGDIVLRAENIAKAFDRTLFRDLRFDIQRGERWGILGGNGTGKTTLLRCLLGQISVDAGQVSLGTGVVVGYFDQMLAEFDPDDVVVEAVRPPGKEYTEPQRRDMLARFGIRGDMVFQKVGQLSGGERNRMALARLAASDVNLLVLDEPTNHLDLWARDALEHALRQFDGTLLCVSHDRFFVNQVVDHLIVMHPDRHDIVLGNFDDYQARLSSKHSSEPSSAGKKETSSTRLSKDAEAESKANAQSKPRRKRRFPYRKVEDLEQEILELETRLESVQAKLLDPEVLRDGRKVKEVQQQIDQLKDQIALMYEHWEEATELN